MSAHPNKFDPNSAASSQSAKHIFDIEDIAVNTTKTIINAKEISKKQHYPRIDRTINVIVSW